ncbi:PP2C family protein-serine/threonine phosphatase [Streptomyces sp. NPDC059176]|uniref:PP2C family protein-serine/threonine phosphatase n=1 Tax=unclassified Streptomyces TaxID=2593676 RepID=UPI00369B4EA9
MWQRERDCGQRPHGGRRVVVVLPALLIAVGVFFDLGTPETFTASPLFAAAPLVAAPFFSARSTLMTGAAAVGALAALHAYNARTGEIPALTELVTVVTVSVLALLINRVIRRSGERLASARVIAEAAQRAVLPTPDEYIDGLQIAVRYEAAQRDAFIGGDLYAVQETPYGVRLVVGDVRGKGLGAVETAAVLLGAFREAAEQEPTLERVARRLERALARDGTRHPGSDVLEDFTTAVLAEIPRGSGTVRIVARGHPSPLLLHADGALQVLEPPDHALPLGMGDMDQEGGRPYEVPYGPGATLLLYTDGLSEVRDAHGAFYDPSERLAGRIFPGPDELLDAIVADVRRYTGGATTDDMALLALSRPSMPRTRQPGSPGQPRRPPSDGT